MPLKLIKKILLVGFFACTSFASKANTFAVTLALHFGPPGTLDWAVNQCNVTPGTDTIIFNIGGGPQTITLGAPVFLDSIYIDGQSENAFQAAPLDQHMIILDGPGVGTMLDISGNEITIKHLVLANSTAGPAIGQSVPTSNDITIVGCYFGLDNAGLGAQPITGGPGIVFPNLVTNLNIGGLGPYDRNLITNCAAQGIAVQGGGSFVNIQNNLIGFAYDGGAAGNQGEGILVNGVSDVTIGGATLTHRNYISNNGFPGNAAGVFIQGCNIVNIFNNVIGLDTLGEYTNPNNGPGIRVDGSSDLTIGVAGFGNVVSGNFGEGLYLNGLVGGTNIIQGNIFGLNANADSARGNFDGLTIDATSNVQIGGPNAGEGNYIGGNSNNGIAILGPSSDNNTFEGNIIGTNLAGDLNLGNLVTAFYVDGNGPNTSTGTMIGGPGLARNVISGNNGDGLVFDGAGVGSATVNNNFIGVAPDGVSPLGNAADGIRIDNGAGGINIGAFGQGNVISGNTFTGIQVANGSAAVQIAYNIIGLDSAGNAKIPNQNGVYVTNGASNVDVGTLTAGNTISGNQQHGVFVDGFPTISVGIRNNNIGLNLAMTDTLGNYGNGINISLVGNPIQITDNVVSGNYLNGIQIDNSSAPHILQGNRIGTNNSDALNLGNIQNGLMFSGGSNCSVGGTAGGEENIIGGNGLAGIFSSGSAPPSDRNVIIGNFIGLGSDSLTILGNSGDGISLNDFGTTNAVIGGWADSANVIAYNTGSALSTNIGPSGNIFHINSIYGNGNSISISPGDQGGIMAPVVECLEYDSVLTGTAAPGSIVYIYADSSFEAAQFLDTAVCLSGIWSKKLDLTSIVGGLDSLTALQDSSGHSSYLALPVAAIPADPLVVTKTIDDGSCGTMRYAVHFANANPGLDSISFNIPGSGPHNIQPLDSFRVTEGVIIDGTSQNIFEAAPVAQRLIEFDGSSTSSEDCFRVPVGALNVKFRHLVINNYTVGFGKGLRLQGDSCEVIGCYIGTDPTGLIAAPNTQGIRIEGSYHTIGGLGPEEQNVISGNAGTAINMNNGVVGCTIQNNLIGVNANQTDTLPNTGAGINSGCLDCIIGGVGAGNIISGNRQEAIYIFESNHQIYGNMIGTDATGTLDWGNKSSGIVFSGPARANQVGDTIAGHRNVIVANSGFGIEQFGSNSNFIRGNFIGVNKGNSSMTNGNHAIELQSGDSTEVVGNVISGTSMGIRVAGAHTVIRGNYIGTDTTGNLSLGTSTGIYVEPSAQTTNIGGSNLTDRNIVCGATTTGVLIRGDSTALHNNFIGITKNGGNGANSGFGIQTDGSTNTLIGGTIASDRNYISNNGAAGVSIFSSTRTYVLGNYIGTDTLGAAAAQNIMGGVEIYGNSDHNYIGNGASGAGNVISGNGGYGINIPDSGNDTIYILGNKIGVGANGTDSIPNLSEGIYLQTANNLIIIGGRSADSANIIAKNSQEGISLAGLQTRVKMSGNSIYNNGGMGIDLNDDGVTTNDPGDPDPGSNGSFNFPDLDSAFVTATDITIYGRYDGLASTDIVFEFFANSTADGTNHGEGEEFLGIHSTTTPPVGSISFNVTLPIVPSVGMIISAIAMDTNGNTSEFSDTIMAIMTGPCDSLIVTSTSDDGSCGTLRGAINYANVTPGIDTITFEIPGVGPHTIQPLDSFTISEGVIIDGTTQNSFEAAPLTSRLIEIDGAVASTKLGFGIATGVKNTIIRHLIINNYTGGALNQGFLIQGDSTLLTGCFIGTNAAGTGPVANGVGIQLSGKYNQIGDVGFEEHNVISGSGTNGISISGDSNYVYSNRIGTDFLGNSAIANTTSGILITGSNNHVGAPGMTNLISGNGTGIIISNSDNIIQSNFIGTNIGGGSGIGNGTHAIDIQTGSPNIMIGGPNLGEGNLIAANTNASVRVSGIGCDNITIQGNWMGVDSTGNVDLGNGTGILIDGGAGNSSNNGVIGGAGHARNVIAGNDTDGIRLDGIGAGNWNILNNFIGVGADGSTLIPNDAEGIVLANNSAFDTIGAPGLGNVVSGNGTSGIYLTGGCHDNIIRSNIIGTDSSGMTVIGNPSGIWLEFVNNITVGGSGAGEGNLISGNFGDGIILDGTTTSTIQGNYIGLISSGLDTIPNVGYGISVSNVSDNNTIGGLVSGAGNVIAGHSTGQILIDGSNDVHVYRNIIGTDINGSTDLSTGNGIEIQNSLRTLIGDGGLLGRNLISGTDNGIRFGLAADSTTIRGNLIGTDLLGSSALPNNVGIHKPVSGPGTEYIRIGLQGDSVPNVISGNNFAGVVLSDVNNSSVHACLVGVASDGVTPLGNNGQGVMIQSLGGGSRHNKIDSNIIGYNVAGIVTQGPAADSNSWKGNSVFTSSFIGISVQGGSQSGVPAPRIDSLVVQGLDTILYGRSTANAVIQLFSDSSTQGQSMLADTVADGLGFWSKRLTGTQALKSGGLDSITAIQDSSGRSSAFSSPISKIDAGCLLLSVSAGNDTLICVNNDSTQLNASVAVATYGTWTGGSGNFVPFDTLLNATYVPNAADTAAGFVDLYFRSDSITCPSVTDTMTITFTPAPTSDAGVDQNISVSSTTANLTGTVTVATGGVWSSTGTGTFVDSSLLSAVYNVTTADTTAGTIDMILTTTGNGNCNAVSDSMTITFVPCPGIPFSNLTTAVLDSAEEGVLIVYDTLANWYATLVDTPTTLVFNAGPFLGTAMTTNAGNISYTAGTGNFNQGDSIQYVVTNGCGTTDSAWFSLFIKNSELTNRDSLERIAPGENLIFNILNLISDPNGNIDLSTLMVLDTSAEGATIMYDSSGNITFDYSVIPGVDNKKETFRFVVCDSLGSCDTATITIDILSNPPDPIIYQAVSPNGDGLNDFLQIDNIDEPEYDGNEIWIYNKWGELVYNVQEYDDNGPWYGTEDGSSSSKPLPDGIYNVFLRRGYNDEISNIAVFIQGGTAK